MKLGDLLAQGPDQPEGLDREERADGHRRGAARITQSGNPYCVHVVLTPTLLAARKITMMPMTLVASLEPWLNDTQLDETICMHL